MLCRSCAGRATFGDRQGLTPVPRIRSCLIATAVALTLAPAAHAAVAPGWAPTASMKIARAGHAAVLLDNGKVLVAGGGSNSAELFDPATGAWTAATPMLSARSYFPMLKLPD